MHTSFSYSYFSSLFILPFSNSYFSSLFILFPFLFTCFLSFHTAFSFTYCLFLFILPFSYSYFPILLYCPFLLHPFLPLILPFHTALSFYLLSFPLHTAFFLCIHSFHFILPFLFPYWPFLIILPFSKANIHNLSQPILHCPIPALLILSYPSLSYFVLT